jgi:hypothetical protein
VVEDLRCGEVWGIRMMLGEVTTHSRGKDEIASEPPEELQSVAQGSMVSGNCYLHRLE